MEAASLSPPLGSFETNAVVASFLFHTAFYVSQFSYFSYGIALTNGLFTFNPLWPGTRFLSVRSVFRCFYRRLFSSSLQSNFLSRLEFGSNVFSFLLMQVFYVFLFVHWDGKLRKRMGWQRLRDSLFVFTFPEC